MQLKFENISVSHLLAICSEIILEIFLNIIIKFQKA